MRKYWPIFMMRGKYERYFYKKNSLSDLDSNVYVLN
jgi:hypothetical protein